MNALEELAENSLRNKVAYVKPEPCPVNILDADVTTLYLYDPDRDRFYLPMLLTDRALR